MRVNDDKFKHPLRINRAEQNILIFNSIGPQNLNCSATVVYCDTHSNSMHNDEEWIPFFRPNASKRAHSRAIGTVVFGSPKSVLPVDLATVRAGDVPKGPIINKNILLRNGIWVFIGVER